MAYGPQTLFTSDSIALQESGTVGTSGSVTSTSSITDINKATTQPSSTGSEALTADVVSGSCSASASGTTGSVTISGGTVETNNGTTTTFANVPTTPATNTKIAGQVQLGGGDTNHVVDIFNEQTTDANGMLTVIPVHEYLGKTLDSSGNLVNGPNSVTHGDLIIGQVVCGVTAPVVNTPPVANPDSYSTGFNTPLTVAAPRRARERHRLRRRHPHSRARHGSVSRHGCAQHRRIIRVHADQQVQQH